jgi:hypothetical protein
MARFQADRARADKRLKDEATSICTTVATAIFGERVASATIYLATVWFESLASLAKYWSIRTCEAASAARNRQVGDRGCHAASEIARINCLPMYSVYAGGIANDNSSRFIQSMPIASFRCGNVARRR